MSKKRLRIIVGCTIGAFSAFAVCLSPSASSAQTDVEKTVQHAMTKGEDGMYRAYDGFFVKWLPHFGDASAVALTKILADKPIGDADIPAILMVVRDSYDAPVSIEDAADRNPRTTIYLLRSLSQDTKDPKNLTLIEQTTAYVKSQYAAYLKNHPNE
jgi:hypothetical protein